MSFETEEAALLIIPLFLKDLFMISLSSRRRDHPPFPLWNSLWFVHSSIDLTTESRRHRKHGSFFALINRDIYCILVYSSILFSIFSHHSTAEQMLLIHVEVNLLYTFVGKKPPPHISQMALLFPPYISTPLREIYFTFSV